MKCEYKIKISDNENFLNPIIKMAEVIFEDMNIDLSKICYISFEKESKQLELKKGSTGKTIYKDGNIHIFILSNLDFETLISTFAHEIGHATQIFGIFKNPDNLLLRFIAEYVAFKFEKKFLIRFNKKYNTNIPINIPFHEAIKSITQKC